MHWDTWWLQAAFKRPGANDVTSQLPTSPRCGVDWDTVKNEDRTLVHQVATTPVLLLCFVLSCPVPAHTPCFTAAAEAACCVYHTMDLVILLMCLTRAPAT